MATILIVEDEIEMANGLKDALEFEGYQVLIAHDGQQGLDLALGKLPALGGLPALGKLPTLGRQPALGEQPVPGWKPGLGGQLALGEHLAHIDLIILDLMLPKKSGFDVCREIRDHKLRVPILMLTARGDEIDKVLGLELGADDYITKPFSLRELLARVKALLRRYLDPERPQSERTIIGNISVDFEHYSARDSRGEIEFTVKEFDILKYLVQHRGETVSRDKLMESVWGYEEAPTSRTVDNHILRLRKKIETDPANPVHILTVHGIGYKYIP